MELTAALLDLCKDVKQPIIAIDGPAGAGKTTLASDLSLSLGRFMKVHTLHMDNYYHGWNSPFDKEWEEILIHAVNCHKSASPLSLKRYDWNSQQYASEVKEKSSQLLILEGVGSGSEFIRENLSSLIWIDVDPELGFKRVMQRDGDGISDEMRHWLELQKQHFQRNQVEIHADFILTT
jgi:uridine kinase